jgi:hypothetical protein
MSIETRQHLDRVNTAWRTAVGKAGASWCGLMHNSPMWPIHGQYECAECGRHYSVPWAQAEQAQVRTASAQYYARPSHGLRAILPAVIVAAVLLAPHAQAADGSTTQMVTPEAAMAFARYTANLQQANPWSLETVEIEAALPKLEKQASLRAIRRVSSPGKAEYQVLEIAGDQTVRRQVITRYLSAEVRAASLPASSVAIVPANYKFRYKCAINTGASTIHVFLITPRKKHEGLIKGELWIDGETGAVVRQSGYLVERPSIFVKRVDVIQEIALSHGSAGERVTRLTVDTRLVGRAELTIHERPWSDPVLPATPGGGER